jgi:hypothetical protein
MKLDKNNPNVQYAVSLIRENSQYLSHNTMDDFFINIEQRIRREHNRDISDTDMLDIHGAVCKLLEDAGIQWIKLVKRLPIMAFVYSDSLSVTLPNNIKVIDNNAFEGSAVESIIIPSGVKVNDWGICSSYVSVISIMDKSLEDWHSYALAGCYGISDIWFAGTTTTWKNKEFYDIENFTVHCSDGTLEYVNGHLKK